MLPGLTCSAGSSGTQGTVAGSGGFDFVYDNQTKAFSCLVQASREKLVYFECGFNL